MREIFLFIVVIVLGFFYQIGGDPRHAAQDPYQHRNIDPRSKSTSNLHVDTNFDRGGGGDPAMRPAQSVGMLHPANSPGYSPGGRRQEVR